MLSTWWRFKKLEWNDVNIWLDDHQKDFEGWRFILILGFYRWIAYPINIIYRRSIVITYNTPTTTASNNDDTMWCITATDVCCIFLYLTFALFVGLIWATYMCQKYLYNKQLGLWNHVLNIPFTFWLFKVTEKFGFYHLGFNFWILRNIHMILYYLLIWDVTYKTLSIYLVNEKIIVSSFLWSSRPLAIFSSQNISNLYLYFRCYAIFSTRSGPKLYLMHIHKFWQIVRHKKYDQSNENRGNFNSLPFLSFIYIK